MDMFMYSRHGRVVYPVSVLLVTDGRECHMDMFKYSKHGRIIYPVSVLLLTCGRKCRLISIILIFSVIIIITMGMNTI